MTRVNQKLLEWIDAIKKSNGGGHGVALPVMALSSSRINVKQLMSEDEFRAAGLSKLSEPELAALNIWVEKETLLVAGCFNQLRKDSGLANLDGLVGGTIVGDDGEFLGVISTSTVDSKSILNEVSRYGSSVSPTSIFNSVSRYGSAVSSLSAFNDIATTPPSVFNKEGKFVAFLTKNTLKTPRIEPNALIGWIKAK